MEHVHASAVDAIVIIAVYVLFKLVLAVLRAKLDDESAFIQAANAIQL